MDYIALYISLIVAVLALAAYKLVSGYRKTYVIPEVFTPVLNIISLGSYRKTRVINEAFRLQGYYYTEVVMDDGVVYKGFLTHAAIQTFHNGQTNLNLQLKFHQEGKAYILPMQRIKRITTIRPPLFS